MYATRAAVAVASPGTTSLPRMTSSPTKPMRMMSKYSAPPIRAYARGEISSLGSFDVMRFLRPAVVTMAARPARGERLATSDHPAWTKHAPRRRTARPTTPRRSCYRDHDGGRAHPGLEASALRARRVPAHQSAVPRGVARSAVDVVRPAVLRRAARAPRV